MISLKTRSSRVLNNISKNSKKKIKTLPKLMFFCFFLVYSFSLCAFAVFAQNFDSGIGVLDRYVAKISVLGTFSAKFTQEQIQSEFKMPDVSSGKIYYRNTDEMVWDYVEPDPYKVYLSNELIKIYTPDYSQLEIYSTKGDEMEDLVSLLFVKDTSMLRRKFIIEQNEDESVTFTPKEEGLSQNLSYIRVWFEDLLLKRLLVAYSEYNHTIIRFSDVAVDEKIGDGIFAFDLPEDVITIDNRERK